MSEFNIYDNTREFERLLGRYTGAPYVVAVDNCCNGIFLCLRYFAKKADHKYITIPRHTYIGVPYAIRAAGFNPVEDPGSRKDGYLEGEYQLAPLPVWDSALRFTSGMYRPGQFQVLSFTGPHKHLKLQKAGAILCPNLLAYTWLRRARFSGRNECSYHEDTFEMPEGYNMYLPAMLSTLGVHLMQGIPQYNPDLRLPYPDWSVHPAFQQINNAYR